jgi:hypothetical protein
MNVDRPVHIEPNDDGDDPESGRTTKAERVRAQREAERARRDAAAAAKRAAREQEREARRAAATEAKAARDRERANRQAAVAERRVAQERERAANAAARAQRQLERAAARAERQAANEAEAQGRQALHGASHVLRGVASFVPGPIGHVLRGVGHFARTAGILSGDPSLPGIGRALDGILGGRGAAAGSRGAASAFANLAGAGGGRSGGGAATAAAPGGGGARTSGGNAVAAFARLMLGGASGGGGNGGGTGSAGATGGGPPPLPGTPPPLPGFFQRLGIHAQAAVNNIPGGAAGAAGIGALVALSLNNAKQAANHLIGGVGQGAAAVLNGSPTQLLHGGISYAQGIAREVGGPVMGPLFDKAIGSLHRFIDGLDDASERLRGYSPNLAVAAAGTQIRGQMFNFKLAKALDPVLVPWEHLKTKLFDVLERFLPLLEKGATVAGKMIDAFGTLIDVGLKFVDVMGRGIDWISSKLPAVVGGAMAAGGGVAAQGAAGAAGKAGGGGGGGGPKFPNNFAQQYFGAFGARNLQMNGRPAPVPAGIADPATYHGLMTHAGFHRPPPGPSAPPTGPGQGRGSGQPAAANPAGGNAAGSLSQMFKAVGSLVQQALAALRKATQPAQGGAGTVMVPQGIMTEVRNNYRLQAQISDMNQVNDAVENIRSKLYDVVYLARDEIGLRLSVMEARAAIGNPNYP